MCPDCQVCGFFGILAGAAIMLIGSIGIREKERREEERYWEQRMDSGFRRNDGKSGNDGGLIEENVDGKQDHQKAA